MKVCLHSTLRFDNFFYKKFQIIILQGKFKLPRKVKQFLKVCLLGGTDTSVFIFFFSKQTLPVHHEVLRNCTLSQNIAEKYRV